MSDQWKDQGDEEQQVAAEPAAEPAEKADPPPIADQHWEAAIAAWVDRLRGGPIAQVTDAWNQLQQEIPKLRDLLHSEMKGS